MNLHSPIKWILMLCLLILLGLLSIQYYLIKKTYDLTKTEYKREIEKSLDPMVKSVELDSLEDFYVAKVHQLGKNKFKGLINANQQKVLLEHLTDSVRLVSNGFIQHYISQYPQLKDVRFQAVLREIIISSQDYVDTLQSEKQEPLVLMGEKFDRKNAIDINNSVTQSVFEPNENKIKAGEIPFGYQQKSRFYMDISNWNSAVLWKMKGILIAAGLLFLMLVGILFWMLRSLLKQRKTAEIKTDFANNLTHELKTPLTSLNLIVKSMQNEKMMESAESRTHLIEALDRQNQRLQNVVNKVLETTIHRKTELENVEVIGVLKQIVTQFNAENHLLNHNLEPENLNLKTDAFQLERIIENLLDNAVKYSPKGTTITLNSKVEYQFFIISIQDQGNGITEANQKLIFDKFHRISQGNQHNVKGLGLGLYLTRQMVENIGGQIEVKSKLNEGSTFFIKIPLQ